MLLAEHLVVHWAEKSVVLKVVYLVECWVVRWVVQWVVHSVD